MTAILHVSQTTDGGGAASVILLARAAADRGWSVVVAAPGFRFEHPAASSVDDVPIVALPRSLPAKLIRVMQLASRADVVHVTGTRSALWALPALVLRPSVVTFQGLHPLRRSGRGIRRILGRIVVQLITSCADAVICVAHSERRDLERNVWVRRGKVHVIHNAVPELWAAAETTQTRARAELDLPADSLVVLMVARLDPAKDPVLAVRTARLLLAEDVMFVLAGDGELMARVQADAPENVRVLGHRDDVPRLLAAADIVLSTSVWEGLPLGLQEAMWAGRAIVASAVAGNAEVLGDAAVLVAEREPEAFAEAIRGLRDRRVRSELGGRAMTRVAREFSVAGMLDRTFSVYDSMRRA